MEGEDPKDERRLWETGGGSMGKFDAIGVPGVDGAGEAIANEFVLLCCGLLVGSGGAGLLEAKRFAGRSILRTLPCGVNVN